MISEMYTSSSGELKDPKQMNTEYIINALSKMYREIFSLTNMEDINAYSTNINVLTNELYNRITNFIIDLEDK